MPGSVDVVLPAAVASVQTARQFVAEHLGHEDARTVDTAKLLVTELVTNAVLHARTEICVRVVVGRHGVRVEVRDRSPRVPHTRASEGNAATGRGLGLVAALADRWGTDLDAGGEGKTVWFELRPSLP